MKQKEILRALMREKLEAFSAPERQAASGKICEVLRQSPQWTGARLVCAFLPMASEPDIRPLLIGPMSPALCFPRVQGEHLELLRLADPALLAQATWRMGEPAWDDCPRASLTEVGLLLVPGMAFCPDGRRLGRGRGYYDRLLAACPSSTRTVGLCFRCQLLEDLPAEPHDRPVQAVLSESGQA